MAKFGGIYNFNCKARCGALNFQRFTLDSEIGDVKCPDCGGEAVRPEVSGRHPGLDFVQPIISEAIGVHPKSVAEHRRAHPEIEMTNDGCVVIRNRSEEKRVLKKLGYMDRRAYA